MISTLNQRESVMNYKQCAKWACVAVIASVLVGCTALSRKVPIQQGNIFDQKMVNQLKPGMSKAQVEAIMGDSIVSNSLDPNRLDYVYTYKKGKQHAQKSVSLFFKNNKLVKISGSVVPSMASS